MYPLCVCVVVQGPDGQILVTGRRHDPSSLGLPGGKVDPEDGDLAKDMAGTLRIAAARELREETGYVVDPKDLVYLCAYPCVDESGGGNPDAMVITYYIEADQNTAPCEGDVFSRWIHWDEFLEGNGAFRTYNAQVYDTITLKGGVLAPETAYLRLAARERPPHDNR